jgi:hypothetical protein
MAITKKRLKELLHYDPDTGVFTWIVKTNSCVEIGDTAGCKMKKGYIYIGIDGHSYYGHRLAWLYVNGYMPDEIDHRDNDKSNNRIDNLRVATFNQNQVNKPTPKRNTSGYKGVTKAKGGKRWQVQIGFNKVHYHLGLFDDPKDGYDAYCKKAIELHGEFARLE